MTAPAAAPVGLKTGDALILVDVQNDFLPGGALAVPEGDAVVGPLNEYSAIFGGSGLLVFATRDWHPPQHCSFKPQGGIWPVHCVRKTNGAALSPDLALPDGTRVISKAEHENEDAYSGVQGTSLDDQLKQGHTRRVFVGGLATDYCVLNTVRDALRLGYETFLLRDAIRGVDVQPGDSQRAIDEMVRLGAVPITRSQLV
jgi:nicotinamidase/pyrazinamidase